LKENFNFEEIALDEEDMKKIGSLDSGTSDLQDLRRIHLFD